MNQDSSIFVTGHKGLVGSAVCRRLHASGYYRVLTTDRKHTDLLVADEVDEYFHKAKPEYVIHCAAKVGGILFHRDHPVAALAENLKIAENVIHAAAEHGVKKLLFLGSACAYPKHAPVPIKEESLLTGPLESSNLGYALAKIAGIELCKAYKREQGKNFISCMPTNIFGTGDNYSLQDSHVLPGMLHRMHDAKLAGTDVSLWGTGTPTREFLYSEDLADACIHLMNHYDGDEAINVGTGKDICLWELAAHVASTVGFTGTIFWDSTKPNGTPKRALDSSKIFQLGWQPKVALELGLQYAYADFLQRVKV